jgi:hypothetical protein
MNKVTSKQPVNPDPSATISFQQPFQDASELDAYVRQAARNMIQQAIDLEVQEFLDAHAGRVDAQGRRLSSVMDTSRKDNFWSPQALFRSDSLGYATPRRIEKNALFSLQSCCLDT